VRIVCWSMCVALSPLVLECFGLRLGGSFQELLCFSGFPWSFLRCLVFLGRRVFRQLWRRCLLGLLCCSLGRILLFGEA
jgi:hypothetical protein